MKKLLLLLLMPAFILAQTANGTETKANAFRALSPQTVTTPINLSTMGTDGTIGKVTSVMNQNANSGILYGGGLAVNVDPTKYDISAGEGYVSNTLSGTVSRVSWTTATAQTTPYLLTAVATYVLKDNTGATVLQTTAPTPQQFRTHIYLGKLAHTTFTTILFAVSEPSRMFNVAGDLHDLVSSFGSINRSGNTITPNGANLQINVSAGETLREGANYLTDRNSPNITTEPAVNATSFRNKFRNGTGGWNAVNTSTVDPNYYDDGTGILALVPNNKFTIKVVYRFGGTGTIHMDYGQVIYDDMDSADRGISAAVSSDPDTRNFASRIGWIIIKQATTSLLDDTKYKFVPADKIGERSAGTSSPTDLQDAYNNSLTPQITTTTDLGAVDVKRGSAADTDKVFRVLNGAGSETFGVTGDGNVTAGSFIKTSGTSSQFLKADGSVDATVYAPNNNVVHLSLAETITGVKTFTAQANFNSSSSGTGIALTQSTSGKGIVSNNNSNGVSVTIENNSTGVAQVINSATASTSDLTRWQKNGTTTSKVDHTGNITGVSFIKSGATAGNILLAGGTDISQSTFATATGGTGYIQNQNASAQSANMWISGAGTFGGTVDMLNGRINSGGSLFLRNPSNTFDWAVYTNSSNVLNFDFNGTNRLLFDSGGAATFASTVTASNGTLIGGTLTTNYIPKATGANSLGNSSIYDTGNVLIGTTTDDGVNKLQVNGSGYFSTGVNIADSQSYSFGGNSVKILGNSGANVMDIQTNSTSALFIGSTQIPRFSALSGTGTRTVVADASGNLSATNLTYKVYKALLTQTGTGAPTATVLDNTLGGTVTFTYNATGYYGISRTGAFTAGKVIVFINGNLATTATFGWSRVDDNTLEISSFDNSGSAANGLFTNASISIEVYN